MKGSSPSDSSMLAGAGGTYAYQCDTGAKFTMTPSTEVASIKLTPGEGATFAETTLVFVNADMGQRFEGAGIVFVGAGEGVTITAGDTVLKCNPVPSTDMAPWNWGDAGEVAA